MKWDVIGGKRGGFFLVVSIGTSKTCDVILFDDVTIQCTLNYALTFVLVFST